MLRIKKIINDILYVSKVTRTKNKKILIITSVALSQLTALADILIISIFSVLIVDQYSGLLIIDNFLIFIQRFKFVLIFIVILRFVFMYMQQIILRKIEFNVSKNLKVYTLSEIFDKKNYSVADAYYYINSLSGHVSYFYSSFASFLNSLLQIVAYTVYLLLSDPTVVTFFALGLIVLAYPINFIIKKSRLYMHETFIKGQEANRRIQKIVENLFLIKLLSKEKDELLNFETTIQEHIYNQLENIKYGLYNQFLPSLLAMVTLATVISLTSYVEKITLVFIGVTLRLFQSLSGLFTNLNQIVNSHVHIEKFQELEKNKIVANKENYKVIGDEKIKFSNVSFKYFNSEEPIFENVNFSLKKNSHTIVLGPNGSGKSTILGLLGGIFYSDAGKVETFSQKFAYIGANPIIFHTSLKKNILYGNKNDIKDHVILKYLKEFDTFKENSNYDLSRKINNKSLSSGQMQKIAFIRALLSEPEILLLDESTANLDKITKNKIFNILTEQNVTIINSTHDPNSFEGVNGILNIEIENEKRNVKYSEF